MGILSSTFFTHTVIKLKNNDAKAKLIFPQDLLFLKKFITEQGKIIPSSVTGVSAKYQRKLTKEIKKARNIALLPYTNLPKDY